MLYLNKKEELFQQLIHNKINLSKIEDLMYEYYDENCSLSELFVKLNNKNKEIYRKLGMHSLDICCENCRWDRKNKSCNHSSGVGHQIEECFSSKF